MLVEVLDELVHELDTAYVVMPLWKGNNNTSFLTLAIQATHLQGMHKSQVKLPWKRKGKTHMNKVCRLQQAPSRPSTYEAAQRSRAQAHSEYL